MKVIGIVPARMAASRFPGKPLVRILGRPMLEHCFERAKLFEKWDGLFVATCDEEIRQFSESKAYPVIMTKSSHTRALDRVAEAVEKCGIELDDRDIVVCVQGDEPMLRPDMIASVIDPLLAHPDIPATVLAMQIVERAVFENPDTVKIVHNGEGEVLFTSRAPVPYCKGAFSSNHGARRIYGIFGWRWGYLKEFTRHSETELEKLESCDSNRILDMSFRQRIAAYPYRRSFSVDSPSDIELVEKHMKEDDFWGRY
ncbi:MAG: 3-deoxy-manno-octulosonate cytidylyltransferase [Bdellovibrionales bacterium]|nr:3-deoxy-manno-octulosonate cytidylyltransferase [Bdellovibrionales bacterium]